MSYKNHYLLFALLLACLGRAGAQVQFYAPFTPLQHNNQYNSLFIGPGSPTGACCDPISYELEVNGRTADDGSSAAIFAKSDATGPSCVGRAEGYLGISTSFNAQGAFIGARGSAFPQSLDITVSGKNSYAVGGNFNAVATNLQFGGTGLGKYYVAGSWNTLSGTPANYSPDGVVAAVVGTDYIKDPVNTWAGYFEGRGYFSDWVGMGTSSPSQRLHVSNGNIILDATDVPATTGNLFFGGVTYPNYQDGMRMSFHNGAAFTNGFIDVRTSSAPTDGLVFRVDGPTGNNERMRIAANGKVAIGTLNMPNSIGSTNTTNYRLYVKGGIVTEQLLVATGWADYVFQPGYELLPLETVEHHILEKGHLPCTPSAAEVEQNGLNLGDAAVNQQEKIEELFLYVIQLNKDVQALKAENKDLKAQLNLQNDAGYEK